MKKAFSLPPAILRYVVLLCLLPTTFQRTYAQCSCGNNMNVNPGDYVHYFTPSYDDQGFVTSYTYSFQFPCMGNVFNAVDDYMYQVIYRVKGTTEWTVDEFGGYLYAGDFLIDVGGLSPCETYEMRVTCPECPQQPFHIVCSSEEQLQSYLDDPSNTLHNVSQIWEVCYNLVESKNLNNFKITSTDMANHSVVVNWDHLARPAEYEVQLRKKPSLVWTNLGTTTGFQFQIENLDPCAEYQARVRGKAECCGGAKNSNWAALDFVATDCVSNLESVDLVTGNSAHVSWSPIGSGVSAYQVQWWPVLSPTSISTANTSVTEYTITGLSPNTIYGVKIITDCGAGTCPGVSAKLSFRTNCELYEPNNTFQTATPVTFDDNHSDVNILPAGDVDFFKFKPTTCDLIEIKVDHPDLDGFPNPDPDYWVGNDLPYELYDENFQPVPQTYGYADDHNRYHNNVHWVVPGKDYYLKVMGWSNTWENANCYTINAFPCIDCDILTGNSIMGEDYVYTLPSSQNYSFLDDAYHAQWSVTGPAILQVNSYYGCTLHFTGTGTVVLTATVTRCNGETQTFHKVIQVSDECNLSGVYSVGNSTATLSEIGFNYLQSYQYTISMNVPAGYLFNVYKLSGVATWTVAGNKIIVSQSSPLTTFRVVISSPGNCYGVEGVYTFYKGGDYPYPPIPSDPVEWMLSPNPTSSFLQISPAVAPDANAQDVPSEVEIRLFNQFSTMETYQTGSTSTPSTLNMNNLVPGNYSLQLIYGPYLKNFTVVKL